MWPAKVVDTETLLDRNALSIEAAPGVCISDEGIAKLDPDGQHIGVACGVSADEQRVLVTWMLAMQGQEERPISDDVAHRAV
jgi:hypothetical protein